MTFVINEICYQEDCIFGCADMWFSLKMVFWKAWHHKFCETTLF